MVGTEVDTLKPRLEKGWDLAENVIYHQFGMDHVYLMPPRVLDTPSQGFNWIGKLTTSLGSAVPNFFQAKSVVAQLIHIQDSSLIVGGPECNLSSGYDQIFKWLRTVSPVEASGVLQRFQISLKTLYSVVRSYPCLYKDFSVLLQQSGELVHLGLDRCYQTQDESMVVMSTDFQQLCQKRIEHFATVVVKSLKDVKTPDKIMLKPLKEKTTTDWRMQVTVAPDFSHSRFDFAQVNLLGGTDHPCGHNKCFYKLKSDPRVGYVAGTNPRIGKNMWKAYNMANDIIKEKYRMQHVFLQPPVKLLLSDKFASWLDKNLTSINKGLRFEGRTTVTAQLVEVMPTQSVLFWGADDNKMVSGWGDVDTWLDHTIRCNAGIHRKNVLAVFLEGVGNLKSLINNHPCLIHDFQIFVRTTGEIVHLDIDRCFAEKKTERSPPGKSRINEYSGRLLSFIKYVAWVLESGKPPAPFGSRPAIIVPNETSTFWNDFSPRAVSDMETYAPLDHYPGVAYVTGSSELLKKAWNFTQFAIDSKNIQHQYLGPPRIARATTPSSKDTAVQLIKLEQSWIEFSCVNVNIWEQLEAWFQMLAGIDQETRMRMLHNFSLSQARLMHLLAKNPCLFHDFRAYLGHDGTIIKGAVHRCFHPDTLESQTPPKQDIETCKQHLEEIANIVETYLRGNSEDFIALTADRQSKVIHICAFLLGIILSCTKLRPWRYRW